MVGFGTGYYRDSTFAALDELERAASRHGLSMIEVALRWLVHHSELNIKDGGNDGIVIGVSRLEHLSTNLDSLEKGPLPEDIVESLNRVWER